MVGFFYSGEVNDIYQQAAPETYTTGAYLASLPPVLIGSLQQKYTQYAGFANLTFNVTDRFDIGAGGRYSYNDQNVSQAQSGVFIGPTPITAIVSDTEKPTTYSFSGRYHFDRDEMLYGRIRQRIQKLAVQILRIRQGTRPLIRIRRSIMKLASRAKAGTAGWW